MKTTLLTLCLACWGILLFGQEPVFTTFKDTRVINAHSTETLARRKLDVRISHRFGDVAGDQGGFATFYGLERAEDVLIGAEYGLTDNVMIGLHRAKGGGTLPDGTQGLTQLLNGVLKFRPFRQTVDDRRPVSVALLGVASFSAAERIENENLIQNFAKFSHRWAYHGELIVARKFSPIFSLQGSAGYTYRNAVPVGDVNGLFSLGLASRWQISRVFGLILDATLPINDQRTADEGFYPALGIGLEIETGGHVFQVNLTNATQIMETSYIPYTTANWLDGQFRLGFTISRLFNL